MSECPKCKQSPRNDAPMICDNDCGTIHCEFCKSEFFSDENHKVRMGHAPWCGQDSDESYVSDSSESESYDSYDSSTDDDRDGKRKSESSNGGSYTDESSSSGDSRQSYDSDSY